MVSVQMMQWSLEHSVHAVTLHVNCATHIRRFGSVLPIDRLEGVRTSDR
jgi:hypothetical protein